MTSTTIARSAHEPRIPAITVGMPVYNGERYIHQAIHSLLEQSFSDFEFVISDNASTDATEQICREYAAADSRIRYIRQPVNIGAQQNFLYVTKAAKAPLVTWLAHDDMLEPTYLAIMVEYMSTRSNVVLAATDFTIVNDLGEFVATEMLLGAREGIEWSKRRLEFFKYPVSNVFYCIYGVMRSDACKKVLAAVKVPKLVAGLELPILSRMASLGEISTLPFTLRRYRRHAESLYNKEMKAVGGKHRLRRSLLETARVVRLRTDLLCVLFTSPFSLADKLSIGIRVIKLYLRLLVCDLARIPSRLFLYALKFLKATSDKSVRAR